MLHFFAWQLAGLCGQHSLLPGHRCQACREQLVEPQERGGSPGNTLVQSARARVRRLTAERLSQASASKAIPNFPNVSEASQASVREMPEARRVPAALSATMLRRSRSLTLSGATPLCGGAAGVDNGGRPAGAATRDARGPRHRADTGAADAATAPGRTAAAPGRRLTEAARSSTAARCSSVPIEATLRVGLVAAAEAQGAGSAEVRGRSDGTPAASEATVNGAGVERRAEREEGDAGSEGVAASDTEYHSGGGDAKGSCAASVASGSGLPHI